MTIGIAFLITVLFSPLFIPFLRRLKFGQSIREEGPQSHQKKSGTPTMGGIMIILSIVITSLIMVGKVSGGIGYELWLLLLVLIGYGLLGFLDDFIKVVMKRNLGLTSLLVVNDGRAVQRVHLPDERHRPGFRRNDKF